MTAFACYGFNIFGAKIFAVFCTRKILCNFAVFKDFNFKERGMGYGGPCPFWDI